MSKSGLIFPLGFLLVSACALSQEPATAPQKSEIASAVTERQSAPPLLTEDITTQPDTKPTIAKIQSPDEIRRLQSAAKELGLDPGPADGVAGNKTIGALQRLQAGCAQLKTLIENLGDGTPAEKTYGRPETIKIQTELRRAGFNIGPVDGAYGSRTRAVVTQLHALCPTMPEYASLLAAPAEAAKPPTAEPSPRGNAGSASPAAPVRVEAVKMVGAPPSARTQEEIRILQLRLRDAGFDPGAFDGVIGPKTEKALQDYQAAHRAGKIKASLTTAVDSMY